MEAIILAGGLGTRLREAVPTLPKCLAPINGKHFLGYVIEYLQKEGITKFIFALGYKAEMIEAYLDQQLTKNSYLISYEDEPLGTGGAIARAIQLATTEQVFVTNGDTLYKANLTCLLQKMETASYDCGLCLKPMQHFSRYGSVEMNADGLITSFKEKQYCETGLINGGIYLVNKSRFLASVGNMQKFSFEDQFLLPASKNGILCGVVDKGYFIDIGIPEDYSRAALELE